MSGENKGIPIVGKKVLELLKKKMYFFVQKLVCFICGLQRGDFGGCDCFLQFGEEVFHQNFLYFSFIRKRFLLRFSAKQQKIKTYDNDDNDE